MTGLVYEDVARFAQQGGTIYFGLVFAAGLIYALWPHHKEDFDRLAQLPLEEDRDDV
ncbi:MAG: cbb3-type cytochrome c oxidase subunit 3 [Phenylobacterium sp.]|uniref:cbb3-type cytochrome c oxidase subunit 3 n=1 Tax=Phenylobacterium sp. TaxID=1871053 RepID=UPI001A5B221E|nr:cbb3-type cytochrome c oxidase subunit 3 [Phenylobacterium sp.]MBL8555835.1 cbb3-type cytochrome c oxidase subunit 3 [Phenylobacterium sp.]